MHCPNNLEKNIVDYNEKKKYDNYNSTMTLKAENDKSFLIILILIILFIIICACYEYSVERDSYLYIYKYMFIKHNKVEKIVDESVWRSDFIKIKK